MRKPKILLVNPPIHDFTAYDFWLKPFGLLKVGGMLKENAELFFFDFLDRAKMSNKSDDFGRGKFLEEKIPKPEEFKTIKRYYRRFGLPRKDFEDFLKKTNIDFALITTTMTYWYPGVKEAIDTIKKFHPKTKIVLGGVYATLCEEHAYGLGADLVIKGTNLADLFDFTGAEKSNSIPVWDSYLSLDYGIVKITEGCPFKCSYCANSLLYQNFKPLSLDDAINELRYFASHGVKNVVFYDDALLFRADEILMPFLERVQREFGNYFNFHTPNALNARFFNRELAEVMVKAGFKTFFFGFDSSSVEWQKKTSGKVSNEEIEKAVNYLIDLNVPKESITVYVMLGHPDQTQEEVEESIRFVKKLGAKAMISEFSPVPKTRDFEKAMDKIGAPYDKPLYTSKTAYPIFRWGEEEVNRLKRFAKST